MAKQCRMRCCSGSTQKPLSGLSGDRGGMLKLQAAGQTLRCDLTGMFLSEYMHTLSLLPASCLQAVAVRTQ